MTTMEIDTNAVEAFAEQLFATMTGGCVAMLVSVGHRTGLLDLMEGLPPATSEDIALTAGLDERYVREWLGGMVTSGIVTYDATDRTYRLPPEHAACLITSAGKDNLALFLRYVGLMGRVEDGVVEAFRSGGGVPYSGLPGFQQLQAEENGPFYDVVLLDGIVPLARG